MILITIVLVVHVLDVLPGVVLSLLTINPVHSLGLSQLVDLSTGDTDKKLLGKLVRNLLAYFETLVSIHL